MYMYGFMGHFLFKNDFVLQGLATIFPVRQEFQRQPGRQPTMGPGDDGEVILVPQSHCCFYPRYIPLVCISLKLVDFIPPSQLFFRVHGHRNPRVICVEDKIRFFVLVLETLVPHPTPSPSPLHSIKFHAFSS